MTIDIRTLPLTDAVVTDIFAESIASWPEIPEVYQPRIVIAAESDEWLAAVLVTARPHTATRKVSRTILADHIISQPHDPLEAILQAVIAEAETASAASITWQTDTESLWPSLFNLGFSRLPQPVVSGKGTESDDAGFVLPLIADWPVDAPHYYRQTTEFTCGSAALVMAESPTTPAGLTREHERSLWQAATCFPGIAPVGLATAVDRSTHTPVVHLSAPGAVLLEHVRTPGEREVKTFVDAEHNAIAARQQIEVRREVISITDIFAHVSIGGQALLLIDELSFHGEPCPHWVLLHTVRDGLGIIHDPWVDAEHGETWIDAYNLPVTIDDVDRITWWGNPKYRGVVLLSPVKENN